MTNLSITPAKLEVQLKPGAIYVQSYIIKNNGDSSIILNSSIDSWVPQGSNGNISYLNSPPDLITTLSNTDLQLGQNFIINPNQSRQLVLKVQVPKDSSLGDRYFTFFVNQDTSANPSINSTQLVRLGSHLLISVSNSELPVTKFSINNFKIDNPIIDCLFYSNKFSGEVTNLGKFFDKIDTSIVIKKNDTEISKLVIFPDNVLANHSRQIRCLSDKSPTDCQLQKPLWPGFYQASINNQTISFVVLPYSILIFIAIVSVITKVLFDKYKHPNL